MQHICIFEDSQHLQLIPLVYTRAAFELRCGLCTPLERVLQHYSQATVTLFCRNYLTDVLQERYSYRVNDLQTADDTCLFLNGRAILSLPISIEGREEIGVQDNTLVYARLKGKNVKKVSSETFLSKDPIELLKNAVQATDTQVPIINYFWDIVKYNKSQIERDFMLFGKGGSISGKLYEGVYFINKEQIFIEVLNILVNAAANKTVNRKTCRLRSGK